MGEMRQQQIIVSLVTSADFVGDKHETDVNMWNLYKIIKEGLDKGNVQYMNLTVNGRKSYGELFKEEIGKS